MAAATDLARVVPVPLVLRVADARDREEIYRARHDVYGVELGQHPPNAQGRLQDALDPSNEYLVLADARGPLGFVSLTAPGAAGYSIDKYFRREDLPFAVDEGLHEVRLLTVLRPHRGRSLAMLLAYAALRHVEHRGGTRIMAIGRREILDFYRSMGLRDGGLSTRAGAVTYDLLHGTPVAMARQVNTYRRALDRALASVQWRLDAPERPPSACFHGGAFFEAVGPRFDDLRRRDAVISADVLDAWYPPAPGVLASLREELPWLLRTSPPTGCEGFIAAVADARGVPPASILPGAGSSDLIFRVLPLWLGPESRVLLPDPTYGEYAHLLERVIGVDVRRFPLRAEESFDIDASRLSHALEKDTPDLAILVNPNSPTGRHLPRVALEDVIRRAPPRVRFWIDETYIEHAGQGESLEEFAADSDRVVVCKSMSKIYALSGARVAYLCGSPSILEPLRARTPPWAVGLPSQLAAVRALEEPGYYADRVAETATLRRALAIGLRSLGWEPVDGTANFLLCRLPAGGPTAAEWVAHCRTRGLFLRDASAMGRTLDSRWIRVAVKDGATQTRMLDLLARSPGPLAENDGVRRHFGS